MYLDTIKELLKQKVQANIHITKIKSGLQTIRKRTGCKVLPEIPPPPPKKGGPAGGPRRGAPGPIA